jgi:CheY-like chemotaxis protein
MLVAADGEEGLRLCAEAVPYLVLMDLGLPGIDGFEATRRIKAGPTTRGIPVVALTARALTSDRQAALDAGCDDYDSKPVDLTRLVDKIHRLTGPREGRP